MTEATGEKTRRAGLSMKSGTEVNVGRGLTASDTEGLTHKMLSRTDLQISVFCSPHGTLPMSRFMELCSIITPMGGKPEQAWVIETKRNTNVTTNAVAAEKVFSMTRFSAFTLKR